MLQHSIASSNYLIEPTLRIFHKQQSRFYDITLYVDNIRLEKTISQPYVDVEFTLSLNRNEYLRKIIFDTNNIEFELTMKLKKSTIYLDSAKYTLIPTVLNTTSLTQNDDISINIHCIDKSYYGLKKIKDYYFEKSWTARNVINTLVSDASLVLSGNPDENSISNMQLFNLFLPTNTIDNHIAYLLTRYNIVNEPSIVYVDNGIIRFVPITNNIVYDVDLSTSRTSIDAQNAGLIINEYQISINNRLLYDKYGTLYNIIDMDETQLLTNNNFYKEKVFDETKSKSYLDMNNNSSNALPNIRTPQLININVNQTAALKFIESCSIDVKCILTKSLTHLNLGYNFNIKLPAYVVKDLPNNLSLNGRWCVTDYVIVINKEQSNSFSSSVSIRCGKILG